MIFIKRCINCGEWEPGRNEEKCLWGYSVCSYTPVFKITPGRGPSIRGTLYFEVHSNDIDLFGMLWNDAPDGSMSDNLRDINFPTKAVLLALGALK